jgi:hypothetical protein
VRAGAEIQASRNKIQAARNKNQASRNEIQIRRNEIQMPHPSTNPVFPMGYGRFRRQESEVIRSKGGAIFPWIGQQVFLEKLNHVFGTLAR